MNNENKAIIAAEAVEDAINSYAPIAEFVNHIAGMHKTLQQKFIGRVVIPLVRELAKRHEDGNFDDRNEWACKTCAAMFSGLEMAFPEIASGECVLPVI